MGSHGEFLELCAAATAGDLSAGERAKLETHLAGCADCRQAMREYAVAIERAVPALASELTRTEEAVDSSWSVEDAEKAFFKRLDTEPSARAGGGSSRSSPSNTGQRFTYRPSQFRWREVWIPFAAAMLLAIALGITLYRTGLRRGMDAARIVIPTLKESDNSLEAQTSDAGYERSQLMLKLANSDKIIEDLKRKLSEQARTVTTLQAANSAPHSTEAHPQSEQGTSDAGKRRDEELAAAQARVADLQKALDTATVERGEAVNRSTVLEAKVSALTQVMRERDLALDQNETEVAKQRELLEHDRDIRELMGARELYMADVHDVTRAGTNKTYGRVFYTKGKSLIFYAFDLDAQPGLQNASSFQAWGRRGPDRQEARSLGILYEDNVGKKRWVLKANDPKSLQDIDAVFVTAEPNGGSAHPSGKQLLFAYLRISPNHP